MAETDEHGVPLEVYDSLIVQGATSSPGQLALGQRAYNSLVKGYGITRVGYLVLKDEAELGFAKNFGPVSLNEIKERLPDVHPNLTLDMAISYVHPDDLEEARALLDTNYNEQIGSRVESEKTVRDALKSEPYATRKHILGKIHPALHPKNLELLTED